jgi:hypothetical protein
MSRDLPRAIRTRSYGNALSTDQHRTKQYMCTVVSVSLARHRKQYFRTYTAYRSRRDRFRSAVVVYRLSLSAVGFLLV